ncbi:MAG: hypothetical protein IKE75_03155 [Bacilli bacterium]|nr:hypothetical protein [Bacilli bacterium]
MSEEERLVAMKRQLEKELKQLNVDFVLGNLKDDTVIREKRDELFKVGTSLELCKMQKERTQGRGR